MARFDVYSKIVTIDGEDYKLQPLDGEDLAVIFRIIKNINPSGSSELSDEDMERVFSEDVVKDIHYVCSRTMQESYPDADKRIVEKFVTRHLYTIYPTVMELNLKKQDE